MIMFQVFDRIFQIVTPIVKYSFFLIIGSIASSLLAKYFAGCIGVIVDISRSHAGIIGLILSLGFHIALCSIAFFQQTKANQKPYLTGFIILLITSLAILKLIFITTATLAYLIVTYVAIRRQKRNSTEIIIAATPKENKNIVYYPISTVKLAGWYVLTFGWYKIYWWYKNWQFIKFNNQVDCRPARRCLFPIFFYYEFLQNVNQTCITNNVQGIKYPKILTGLFWTVFIIAIIVTSVFQVINQTDPAAIKAIVPYTTLVYMIASMSFLLLPQMAINRSNQQTSIPTEKSFTYFAGIGALVVLSISVWLGYISGVVINSRTDIHNATVAMNYRDYPAAYKYANLAAKNNDPKADYFLGAMYLIGKGVNKDAVQAAQWFEKSANQGDIDAQYQLAALYHNGEGVTKDDKKSVYWLQKAADAGNTDALSDLGFAYNHGQGVAKNSAKAMELYQKAAGKGDSIAMYNLGFNYGKNATIPNHYALAASWYQKSMEQEPNPCAANDLAILYAIGQGVPKDTVKAKSLFKSAALLAFLDTSFIKFDEDFSYADHHEVANAYADFAFAQATHNKSAGQLADSYSPLAVRGAAVMARGIQTSCWQ